MTPQEFIAKCAVMDPNERWSATEALQHRFLKKACAPEKLSPYVKRAKEEADRSYLEEEMEAAKDADWS